jgi:hypothetical protein
MAKNEIEMLLLGAGESGKVRTPRLLLTPHIHPSPQSTVLKQMKLIHHGGYNNQEWELYKGVIHSNAIQSMRCETSHPVCQPSCSSCHPGRFLRLFPPRHSTFPPERCQPFRHPLSPGSNRGRGPTREFQLNDSAVVRI